MAQPESWPGGRAPEQPAAIQESLIRLEQAVGAIHDSETFRAYLDAQARFHSYSFGNVLLILAQKPDATSVAGYQTWKSLGRQVRRGEKGIRIIVPMRGRSAGSPTESGASDDEEVKPERTIVRFGTGSVFDISQTEGKPLPSVDVPILEGEEGTALYDRLATIAADEHLTLERTGQLPSETMMGYYEPDTRRVVVREASPRQMAKTLAHELAHHFGAGTQSSPEEETMAESVAYVVCAHFDLDTGERSFPYIATWSQDAAVLKGAMSRIQQVSNRIIGRLDPPAQQRRGSEGS
jgi:antirestriction protein ArdC